jgi:prephenate dehydrogenase
LATDLEQGVTAALGEARRGEAPRTVGIIGFGAFGRLIATHLRRHFALSAYDPATAMRGWDEASGVTHADLALVAACDVVILATPVDRLAAALAAIRDHLKPGALVLDVCSVKVIPSGLMRELLPDSVEAIGTHPLFGPQSGRDGIAGLKMAVCPIRTPPLRRSRARRLAAFVRKALGLKVFITTPEDHDREAAMVQGLTHLIAKVLVQMEPLPTRMTTASFDRLMQAVDMVRYDAAEVFLAIERLNPYSADVRDRFFSLSAQLQATLEEETAAS